MTFLSKQGQSPAGTVPARKGQSPLGTVPASNTTVPGRKGLSPKGTVPAPRRTVPLRKSQRGYLLVTVIITLFLLASIAVLLSLDSANSANTSNRELESARADYVAAAGLQNALWRLQNNACMGDVTIPDTALGNDTYSATITGAAAGTLFQLAVDQDAWIRNDDVTKNNGDAAEQHIRFEGGNIEHALTRFDLSSLPKDAQINSAVAWFYVSTGGASGGIHPEGPLTVHNVTADWIEDKATWENMGGNYEKSILAGIPAQEQSGVWVSFNLTGQVQAWVNGQPNYGILMASTAEGVHGKYASKEDGSNPPRLEVVVGSGPASPVTIKAKGELDNGVKRELKDKTAIAYQPPVSTVLQPGSEGKDGAVRSANPNDNFGTAVELRVTGGAEPEHALIQFAVEQIPAGSRIASARMEVYLNWLGSADPAAEFSVHPMSEAWTEGTGDSWDPGDGANWNTANGSQAWDWQSNHDATNPVDTIVVDPSYSGWHSWDITALAQQWSSGERENFGVVIKGNANVANAWFRSSDYSDASQHPRLTIEYACECGNPCMGASGSGRILMPASSSSNPSPDELLRINLLESMGYVVEPYWAKNSQSNWNSKMANFDVVYVPATANAGDIGSKLTNATIGVVHELGALNDELGFEPTGSSNWPVGNSIKITDASHYITAPFLLGDLKIYAAYMSGLAMASAPAAGVEPLADWQSGAGLAVLEAGAKTADGGAAAGRRAMLPFGQDSQINWSQVNNNGRLILQRALAWGTGVGKTYAGNLLMVVVDPSSLTTQEEAKRTLIESWGYTVNLIDESASQGEFDAAVAANDVAYVAEDIATGQLGTKLREAPIGVVIEEEKITDEFGISSGETTFTEASIEVTDNTHYITQPFSLGAVTFSSSAQPVGGRGGTLAPGLAVLAERPSSSTSMLDVIETGGVLFDTGTAAGRRVKLPWGGNDFDINSLTTDGLNIMRRAIEWGAAAGVAPTLPIAHWKFDETSGTTAVDSAGGNDGTLAGDASWAPGVLAGGLSLDGAGDRVDVSGLVGSPTSLTITAWVNLASAGFNGDEVVNLGNNVLLRVDAVLQGGTYASYWDGSSYRQTTSGQSLGGSGWRHIAYTFDDAADQQFLYIDGVEAGSSTFATSISYTQASNTTIGAHPSSTSYNFNGQIDDLRIYNVALTAAEIAELATVPAPSGPVAHWKLDETSGTTAVDSAGSHDGTTANTSWVAGHVDGGLQFNSSSDSVTVPHSGELSLTDALTLTAWINKTQFFGYDAAITKATSGSDLNFFLGTWENNPVFGFSTSSDNWQGYYATSTSLATNTWYHLAATFDNSADAVRIYIDGTLAQSFTSTLTPLTNVGPIRLGRSAIGEYWPGILDDVRVYDTVLSAQEIADLAGSGGGGGGGGGGGSCNGPFTDTFDAVNYSGGSTNWATNWQETGETTSPSGGDIRIDNDVSNYQLLVRDDGQTVWREADLSNATSATLSFDYRRENLSGSNDYVAVDVSYDGGNNWSELDRFIGTATDSSYLPYSKALDSNSLSNNTRIRFRTPNSGMGNNNMVWFDNIEITCAP